MESTGKSPVSSDRKPKRQNRCFLCHSEIAIFLRARWRCDVLQRCHNAPTSRGVTVSSDTFLGGSKPKHEDTHWRGDAPH
ncbi:hypothetical protein DY000_02057044 [Brassica cretica]|uniref:Uncharacterized protein n=1 Tax=Brassica cretica TaxID=69181 RepID=A0ABQ7A8Z4_BRACR|nr:hypothetical protein DY000_02057044 [Brassica cretica]